MRHVIPFLLTLLLAGQSAHGQAPRRVSWGFGIEGAAKARILPNAGSRYGLRGSYSAWGALQFLPVYERGFRGTVNIGYAVDEGRYNYAPDLVFSANRHVVRTEFEGLIPIGSGALWLAAAIGVDWNVVQEAKLTLYGGLAEAINLANDPDLPRADLDLFLSRRLLVPNVRLGPALRFPTGTEGKTFWLQFFVRQSFLDSYEEPVVVTLRDPSLRPQQIVVSQRPTYIGLSGSYFF